MRSFENIYLVWRTVFLWLGLSFSVCLAQDPLAVFTADWCEPCRKFKQDFETGPDALKAYGVEYVDYDKNKELAKSLGVTTVPTFILYDNAGKEVKRVVGYKSLAELKAALNK